MKTPLKNGPSILTLAKTRLLFRIVFGTQFANSFTQESTPTQKISLKKEFQKTISASFYLLAIKNRITFFLRNILIP